MVLWPGLRACALNRQVRKVIQQTVPKMAALCRAAWIIALIARASAQSGTTAAPPMADIVNLSGEKLAIYAIGTLVDGGKNEVPDFEVMTDLLAAGESAVHGLKYDTALVVRSANLVWRAKISLYQGGDAARPYVLAFKNLMFDHIHGSAPPEARGIEIKLGEGGGFVWVRPFEEELQTTDVGHVFELRDQYHTPMVSIRLRAGQAAEEL